MDAKEERLVARLRHHNPTLTVTELHIGQVDYTKKNLVINYINSLKLNAIVESSPGLETVVSVDISSRTEQDDIFKKLLSFIRNIGIGEISVTSEPFDEQQPEIESTGSIPAVESSSRDYTPMNSDDIEELISRDKSESEFELILSRPRRSSSRDSRLLHSDQSSMDVIGSLLKVSEGGRSQISGWSLNQHTFRVHDRSSKNIKPKSHHRIHTFWCRAKKIFKKKRNSPNRVVGQYLVEDVMVSKDSMQTEGGKSIDQSKLNGPSILREINAVSRPNQVSLNTLQKRLEKVSHEVFSLKNKCPGMKNEGPSLDVYTQTQVKPINEPDMINNRVLTVDKKCSCIELATIKCHNKHNQDVESLSAISLSSSSTESESQVMKSGVRMARQSLRGMVSNLIPMYPNVPANLKRPVMCELKPVGGPFFFRRVTSTKTSSISTATSCLTTTTSNSLKSTRSTVTFSSLSCPSISQETYVENCSCSSGNVMYNRTGHQYLSCGVVSTPVETPFEREKPKKTQTVKTPHKAQEINTTEVFKLPKETQTSPKKRKRTPPIIQNAPSIGTQTFSCSNSTSGSELVNKKSCGTKTENEVERADKENSCYLLTKQPTETKETNSETSMLKCVSCQGMSNKQVDKKRKSPVRQKNDRSVKKVFNWGQFPDGNFGFGQRYAPGKVFPVISLATPVISVGSPFYAPTRTDKEPNQPCPTICNLFGGKKRALLKELQKQKMELMQMKMMLVAINEELLAECTDTSSSSSSENMQSSDDIFPSAENQVTLKHNKKVTFREPLVNEHTLSYADFKPSKHIDMY